jgi:hypothetical protein
VIADRVRSVTIALVLVTSAAIARSLKSALATRADQKAISRVIVPTLAERLTSWRREGLVINNQEPKENDD